MVVVQAQVSRVETTNDVIGNSASGTKAMGDVTSIQYSGTGHLAGIGPDEYCPRWNADITGFNNGAYEQGRLV